MPAISISDDQRERLRWIQRRLGDDVEYGHVRPRDALEYLLDRFDEADDEPVASNVAASATAPADESAPDPDPESGTATDGGPGTASAAESAFGGTAGFSVVNGGGVSVVEKNGVFEGPTDEADEADDHDTDESDHDTDEGDHDTDESDHDTDEGDHDTDEGDHDDHDRAGEGDAEADDEDGNDGQADDGTDGDGTADGDGTVDDDGPADADDEARLNSVMSLLDDHDDRWSEASGGEEKYEVDLPDGTTERARTKDDVRALLFQHYR